MKKYRVVTDNLEFAGVKKGHLFKIWGGNYQSLDETGIEPKNWVYCTYDFLSDAILHNPEWFSEIKEDKEELIDHRIKYSENDLLKFGRLVRRTFNFTDSDSVVQSLLSDYKAAKFSPKEEAKEFTRKDMCVFASYAHCYHSKKLSYDALLSEWEGYYHNK